jgi:hypothetical protein
MAMLCPDQGVSDFVEDGVSYMSDIVSLNERLRQLDLLEVLLAGTESALVVV